MENIQYGKFLGLVLFLLCSLFLTVPLHASDDLRIEGIAHDPHHSAGSLVVVNGTFLKEGDVYQNYKILKINPNSVHVQNAQDGTEKDLYITGGRPSSAEPDETGTSETDAVPSTPESVPSQTGVEKILSEAVTNPLAVIGLAREVSVIADLKQIHMAGSAFFAEYEMSEEISLKKLTERGMISRAFEGGVKGGYRFSVKTVGGGVVASADPVNDSPTAKHFYVDEHGVLFEAVGGLATDKSRPRTI